MTLVKNENNVVEGKKRGPYLLRLEMLKRLKERGDQSQGDFASVAACLYIACYLYVQLILLVFCDLAANTKLGLISFFMVLANISIGKTNSLHRIKNKLSSFS